MNKWEYLPVKIKYCNNLSARYVRSILDYNPETGIFTWRHRPDAGRVWNLRFAGKVAGNVNRKSGYHRISINGSRYYSHRLVWLLMTGKWPVAEIDHRDKIRSNNKFNNLRQATHSQNHCNKTSPQNRSGYKGVYFDKKVGRFGASIKIRRRSKFLGYFSNPRDGYRVYCAEAKKLHGEFARVA